MPEQNLTVKVDAETDDAVEAIDEVTAAVERLADALERLEGTPIKMTIDSVGDVSHANLTVDANDTTSIYKED